METFDQCRNIAAAAIFPAGDGQVKHSTCLAVHCLGVGATRMAPAVEHSAA